MSFNLESINTGTTANDGNGDPLRTAFYYTYLNDLVLSGEIIDLSGNVAAAYEAADNALSGNFNTRIESTGSNLLSQVTGNDGDISALLSISGGTPTPTNRSYDNLNSGEYVDVTGAKTGAIYNGDYSLSISELHYGTGTSYSSSSHSYNHGGSHVIGFPVYSIGGPFDANKDYKVHATLDKALRVTRTSDPKDVTVSGAGTVTTDLDGTSYHYLQVHLREY
jgi:hypothetical protein